MRPANQSEGEIFDAALACSTPAERAAYLDQACAGQPELRQRIEALLAAHEAASQFLEPKAVANPTIRLEFSGDEKPGDVIGHYKIREKIGEGGCGVVYVADQEQPVRRRVALKVVKLGMDTKQVVARFEAERQALALMDHPNIAKVFDAGSTSTGRPFFVMELVRGIKITDYCDQNNLSTEDRLKLFMLVCQAVQHAHQKGIIHRDIKPSNVLVTLHDGVPVPKVIDFGIAKATSDQRLTDKTIYTAFEQFLGTPAYMSPEQAEMSGLDIDTRSDIYSLGVLLYELLTGKTPFDAKTLLAAGIDQMRRIIREQEPQRPSTRLSTLTHADLTTLAKQRHAEAPKLIHLISGDLDWIVMKCLEKDRTRRYDTANGLAAEIQRHLSNEPVIARPPSVGYRVQKLVRRNKLAVASVGIVIASLLLGLVGTTWQSIRASQSKRHANQERMRAEAEAIRADQNAEAERTQRQKAETSARRASEALSGALVVEGERLVKDGAPAKALAFFAQAVRINSSNYVAATRIVSMLNQRDFPLPLPERPKNFGQNEKIIEQRGRFSLVGTSIVETQTGKVISNLQFGGELYRDGNSCFSPDEQMVAFVDSAKQTRVFFTRNGEPVLPAIPIGSPYTTPKFSPDGRNLVTGYKSVEVWDMVTKKRIFQTSSPMDSVHEMSYSPDGRMLAIGVRSRESRLLSLASGVAVREPCIGSGTAHSFKWSVKGDFLIIHELERRTGPNEWTEKFWDIRVGRAIPMTLRNSASVQEASYDSGGLLVTTVCKDGSSRIWSAQDGSLKGQPAFGKGLVAMSAFSPDSSFIALGGQDGEVGVWDVKENRLLWSADLHPKEVTSLVFSPDGKRLFTGSGSRYTWDVVDACPIKVSGTVKGNSLGEISSRNGAIESMAISPDGRRLAIAYKNHRAEVWDTDQLKQMGESLKVNQGWVWHVQFSHDGRLLATSSGGEVAQIWSATSVVNKPLEMYQHESGVGASFFSADDKLLLTCSADTTARVWDRETGNAVTEPLRHTARVRMGGFSKTGKEVLTCSEDGTAVVWDIQTGRAISDPFRNRTGLTSASFSPDGTHILVAGVDGTAKIYRWLTVRESAPEWLPELAEAISGYRISEKEILERITNAATTVERVRAIVNQTTPSTELSDWAKWYLMNRGNRTVDDISKISVHKYANRLANENCRDALEEAVDLDAGNPIAYANLARFVEITSPETAALYRMIAKGLGATEASLMSTASQTSATAEAASNQKADELLDPKVASLFLGQVGKTVKIKGRLVKFGTSRSATFHYLNFSQDIRSGLTLAFRIADNPDEFQPELLRAYLNKTVIVEGVVAEHLGTPQFLMTSTAQIKVVEQSQ